MANQILDLTPSGPLNLVANQIQKAVINTGQLRFRGMLSLQPTDNPPLNIRPYNAYYGIIGAFRAGYLLNIPDFTVTAWNALTALMADMDSNGYTHDYVWANRQFKDGTISATKVLTSPTQAQFTPADVGSQIIGTGLIGTVTISSYISPTQVQLTGTTSVVTTPQVYDILSFSTTGQWVTRAQNILSTDSVPANAGMFLNALYTGWQTTRDFARLQSFTPGIVGALTALTTTKQPNGMFVVLPDGLTNPAGLTNTATLQDQAEVCAGCRGAAYLLGPRQIIPGFPDLGQLAQRYGEQLNTLIRTLWDYTNPGRTVSGVGMVSGSSQLTGAFVASDVGAAISTGTLGVPLGATITAVLSGGTAVLDRPATATSAAATVTTVVPGFRTTQNIDNVPQQTTPDWANLNNAYAQLWPTMWGVIERRQATSQVNHFLATQPNFYSDPGFGGGAGEWALHMAGRPTEALVDAVSYPNSTFNTVKAASYGYPFTVDKAGQLVVAISADVSGTIVAPRA